MLSSVLHSERAALTNVAIMRAFSQVKYILSQHQELLKKVQELEKKYGTHDQQIRTIIEAIRQLMNPRKPKAKIGFRNS